MKRMTIVLAILVLIPVSFSASANPAAGTPEAPVKGMVTMLDLGAHKCIPCKLMAPILEKLKKKYDGRAAIVFIDVWKDPAKAKHYGIKAIPTQIFYDEKGGEVYRHVGFMSEKSIVARLKKMGVKDVQ